MPINSSARTVTSALASFLLLAALGGCHHRKTAAGSLDAPGKPDSVDTTWVTAAKSCWPELAKNGYTDQDIRENLVHHIGAAFPTYSALSRNGADADLSMPLTSVLPPDTTKLFNSATPVLTRGQAVAGTPPSGAIVASTHGSAPPDALCSIQQGVPQDFSK